VQEKNYSKDLLAEAVKVMELLDQSYNTKKGS
jgi:hypothetical protein